MVPVCQAESHRAQEERGRREGPGRGARLAGGEEVPEAEEAGHGVRHVWTVL